MEDSPLPPGPPATNRGTRPLSGWRISAYGLGGFLLTPIVVYAIGQLLFGGRASWNWGQGEGFIAFLLAIYAILFGATYWMLAAVVESRVSPRAAGRQVRPVAAALYLAGIVGVVIVTVFRYR